MLVTILVAWEQIDSACMHVQASILHLSSVNADRANSSVQELDVKRAGTLPILESVRTFPASSSAANADSAKIL